ncbi:protein of unknown function [Magnetospirillum sp. XM-1]|uniref:hypothetical protein n=1 Tax=Magnetospirillum sp. XM-1 TaxID=1663591 RepID=UPI00073DE250|nr:hypothetical protein [Magnetospirillum sp. XM-1]CUW38783.1 protein of unknown function [Magnetospirillum sp. XM-1]
MPYYPGDNTDYLQMLGAGSSLAKSLFGDPAQMARHELYQKQGGYYEANASKARQETADLQEAASVKSALPGMMTEGWANDPATRQRVMSHMVRLGKDYLPHIGGVTQSIYGAGDPSAVNQSALANMVVANGGDYAKTQLGFTASDATERRGQDISSADSRYGSDTSAAAQRYGYDKTDTRERWKFNNPNYVQTNKDQTTTFRPDVAQNMGLPGVVVQGVSGAADGKVNAPAWTDKEDQALEVGIAKVLGGLSVDAKGNQGIDPNLLMAIPPEKMAVAKAEAAKVFQTTKNMQSATDAAVASLGYAQGSKYTPADERSWPAKIVRSLSPFDILKDTPAQITPPAAAAPVKAPQQPAIPPMASRVKGKVYDTPRGPMTWTGTGWVPAAPGA